MIVFGIGSVGCGPMGCESCHAGCEVRRTGGCGPVRIGACDVGCGGPKSSDFQTL